MSLSDFLRHRQEWRQAAPAAARALAAGDLAPAAEMLGAWRFSGDPVRLEAILGRVRDLEPRVHPAALAMSLGDPEVSGVATAHEWRDAAFERPGAAPAVDDLRAWVLAELAAVGWLVEETTRRPWTRALHLPDEKKDRVAARLWRSWGDMSIFAHEDAWERLTMEPMLRGFRAVLRGRRVPEDRLSTALADAREGWFPYLYGGDPESMSWRELAVRVLEAAGDGGPVDNLAAALPPDRWFAVGRCAVTRGHGSQSAKLAWSDLGSWLLQAREVERGGLDDPTSLGDLLDLHLAARLVTRWQEAVYTPPGRTWNVITNNRGRARARLRALLREAPAEWLIERLVVLPGLAARTRAAAARFGKDWAWQCHQNALTFSDSRTLDPACHMPEHHVAPYTDDELAQLRSWVLNVLVKGRLAHLEAWSSRKNADGIDLKDATWGRLLSDEIPSPLRSAGPDASRDDGLQRLRAELVDHLPAILHQLTPVIEAVAAIEIVPRRMQVPFDRAIAGVVRPEVKPLKVQLKRYVENAREVLPVLRLRFEEGDAEEDE